MGPNASGKSELAVRIAKKFKGEVISADSRQIYRNLDIGTGKVPGKWKFIGSPQRFVYKGVPHHCIDFVSPKRTYTVAEYKQCAQKAIKDITARGKLPILAGGTGFWIDAVVYDLKLPEVPPNPKLRGRIACKSAPELLKMLERIDSERAKTIEQKNPRRLIRAIEIVKALGKVPPLVKKTRYQTVWIGLTPSSETRSRKIRNRVVEMVKSGLVEETKKLLRDRVPQKRIREFGFEYRAALDYLQNGIDKEWLHQRIVRDSIQYAHRQITWWKKNPQIHWFADQKAAEKSAGRLLISLSPHPN